MRCRGFFAFVLVIFFLLALTESYQRNSEAFRAFSDAKAIAFELERQNTLRTNMENSLDFAVERALRREILLGNTEPLGLKLALDEKVFSFFRETQKSPGPERIEFSGAAVYGNSYSENAAAAETEPLSIEFLHANSVAFAEKIGGIWVASYGFAGGIYRNMAVIGEIVSENGKTKTVFFLPAGYSKTVAVPA